MLWADTVISMNRGFPPTLQPVRSNLRAVRPAGQTADPAPASTDPTPVRPVDPTPSPPVPAPSPPISIGPDGRLIGIEPILDQIATSVSNAAAPLFEQRIWPVIQRDVALQRTIGAAAGRAAADRLRPWVILGVGAVTVIATIKVWKLATGRYSKPSRSSSKQ